MVRTDLHNDNSGYFQIWLAYQNRYFLVFFKWLTNETCTKSYVSHDNSIITIFLNVLHWVPLISILADDRLDIGCDFEEAYQCGYRQQMLVNGLSTWKRFRGAGLAKSTSPAADSTGSLMGECHFGELFHTTLLYGKYKNICYSNIIFMNVVIYVYTGQKKLIETIQERALKIIMPNASYELAQQISELPTLETRHADLCRKLFKEIQDPSHKLHHLLPPIKKGSHDLRDIKKYPLPKINTNRGKATFINWCLFNLQWSVYQICSFNILYCFIVTF